jgi:excisionase family DNA binding protein
MEGMTNATAQAEFLSVSELAPRLRVSRTTAYQLVRDGQVPSIRLGGTIRIPTRALDRWLAEREAEALAAVGGQK